MDDCSDVPCRRDPHGAHIASGTGQKPQQSKFELLTEAQIITATTPSSVTDAF